MLCVGCVAANAQSSFTQRLQQSRQGEGRVTVTQDKAIEDLVNGPKVTPSIQNTQSTPTPQNTLRPLTQQATNPQQSEKEHKESNGAYAQKTDSSKHQHPQLLTSELPDTTVTPLPDDGRKKIVKGYKVNGYRVQVYAGGNSRKSRIKAERIGREIKALFPDTPIYVHFYPPRWLCRMGNYRTVEEASEVLRTVKKLGYSSAILVKGKIIVPYQQAEQSLTNQQQ